LSQDDPVTPGPHSLRLRAIVSVLPPVDASIAPAIRFGFAGRKRMEVFAQQPLVELWPEGGSTAPLHKQTIEFANFSINLFEQYPPDFPHTFPLSSLDLDHPPESWFGAAKARIVRAQLSGDHTDALVVDWPPGSHCYQKMRICPSAAHMGSDIVPIGMEIMTNHYLMLPTNVAAEVSFRVASGTKVVDFHLVAGPNEYIGDAVCKKDDGITHWFRSTGMLDCDSVDGRIEDKPVGTRTPSESAHVDDGVVSGVLEIVPSRQLALEAQSFDTYLGESLSIPLNVEIITVPARPTGAEE
jgi:hypothetical protein